jgi:hypothetical protein
MNKESTIYIHNEVLFSHKAEWNYVTQKKMYETRDHVIQVKLNSERQTLHFFLLHVESSYF